MFWILLAGNIDGGDRVIVDFNQNACGISNRELNLDRVPSPKG